MSGWGFVRVGFCPFTVEVNRRKASRNSKIVYNCFVDFQKAFDSIKLDIIWATLRSYGVGKRLVQILRDMGERSKMAVKVGQEVGEWFTTTIGKGKETLSHQIYL